MPTLEARNRKDARRQLKQLYDWGVDLSTLTYLKEASEVQGFRPPAGLYEAQPFPESANKQPVRVTTPTTSEEINAY